MMMMMDDGGGGGSGDISLFICVYFKYANYSSLNAWVINKIERSLICCYPDQKSELSLIYRLIYNYFKKDK